MTHKALRESAINRSLISLAVASCFTAGIAIANPTGPNVVSGSVSFQQPSASALSVTNSPGAIIQWQGFSIGAGEVTRFIQQSAASTVLNRVVGGNLSQIYGQLLSNGQVYLVNPGGIVVGPGAIVDTAGFVASTLNMVDADFLAGKLKFAGDANSGAIVNQGWIRTGYGGKVVLVAPHVENAGLIHTPGGELILAAGQKLTIASLDHEGVQFELQAPADSVVNLGKLLADGGAVGVFAGTLRHSGDIRANSLVYDQAGQVVLRAANEIELAAGSTTTADGRIGGSVTLQATGGLARVAGTVSAQGSAGKGGYVRILGERVAVVENAVVNASGSAGGGQVLIGGDFQGGNAAVQNASNTFVGADATVRADATGAGDGGRIIVWSDDKAQFYGSLSAQGGPVGGNGGFAEVSGKRSLVFAGRASLGAPKGKLGSLLLDPLDLYVDVDGGLIPDIIDENTDFPSNAATVSPDTLANIVGNVTLYASRYMRINSAIDLTTTVGATPTATPGKTLTATVGTWPDTVTPLASTDPLNLSVGTVPNQLDIGAGITTANGAVSLTAPRIQSVAASTIATAGGAVTLSAAGAIQASSLAIDAGTGAVSVTAGTDSAATSRFLQLGAVAGGSFTASAPDSVQLFGDALVNGGAVTLSSANGSFSSFSTIDTRAGGTGPAGGAVSITAPLSVATRSILAGSGNITLSGSTLSNSSGSPLDTTGAVSLTATAGNIGSFRINNAAGVTANATNANGSASVNLSSDTVLNASTVTATTTNCSSSGSCSGAAVSLSGDQGVNVGTVTASAPVNTVNVVNYGITDTRFENRNESVSISSLAGSILASGATSLVKATDVALSTIPSGDTATGGAIGSSATPLNVEVGRRLTFHSGGDFNVKLQGATGPNWLDVRLGVAPATKTWTGSLTGTGSNGVTLNASATESKVTVSDFSLTGFDQRIYNQSPNVSLNVPNGDLTATTVSVPKGDNTGWFAPANQKNQGCSPNGPAVCTYPNPFPPPATLSIAPQFEPLGVSVSASGNLQVDSYTRAGASTDLAKSTSIASTAGAITLGTVNVNRDSLGITGPAGVTISNLAGLNGASISSATGDISLGTVSLSGGLSANSGSGSIAFTNVSAATGASASTSTGNITLTSLTTGGAAGATTGSGNITLGSVVTGTGGATLSAPLGTVQAATDSPALEVTSGGTISISAKTIGPSGTNPLDLAGATVILTSNGGGAIGLGGAPVVANTQDLTVNAGLGSTFNVSTGTTDLKNLAVTANPATVGDGLAGKARVASNGSTYDFPSSGTGFTLGGGSFPAAVPVAQFAGGTLSFTATSGNLTLNALDFSASNGNFSAATNGSVANITQTAGQAINLGKGTLGLRADGNVVLEGVNAGGMTVANATSNVASGCNSSFGPCGVTSFTANQTLTDTANGNGTWSVTSRGAIGTGALEVANIAFTTNATGSVTTGAIGTGAKPATSVSISTTGSTGDIQTGAIEADALTMSARGTIAIGSATAPANINAANTDAASISLSSSSTVTVSGDLNASSVTLTSPSAITTGNINATAASAPASITFNSTSGVDITTGSLDAKSVIAQSACSFYSCPPANITINGAIGATTRPTTLSLDGNSGSVLNIAGPISLDTTANTDLRLTSGGAITLGGTVTAGGNANPVSVWNPNVDISAASTLSGPGLASLPAITAGNGSSIRINANNGTATPFQFTRIDAGATGAVSITADAGIIQTTGGASDGITASTVRLDATNTGAKIEGPASTTPFPLNLRETTDLTLTTNGSVRLARSGAAGIPLLSNLDITRYGNSVIFDLGAYASGQSVNVGFDASGGATNIDVVNTSATPLNFSFNNYDAIYGGLNVTAAGIATKGGNLSLYSTGNLNTGVIDTRSGSSPTVPDGSITMSSGQTVNVSGAVNSGAGSLYAQGAAIAGAGPFVSTSDVTLYAFNGNIGVNTAGGEVQINAPTVSLTARGGLSSGNGNVFGALVGTTDLAVDADEGFRIGSTAPLTSVSLATEGTGRTGPVTLTTTGAQSFGLVRNGAAIDISGVTSTPALGSFGLRMNTGDLTVKGGIAADELNLSANSGTLTLDGSGGALTLSNAAQTLSGNAIAILGDVTANATNSQSMTAWSSFAFTGKGKLSSDSSQYLYSYGTLDLTAQGGQIDVTAATQTLWANSNLKVTAAGGPVNITSAGRQNIFAYGNLDFAASGGAIAVQGADQDIGGYFSSVMTLQGGASTGQSVTFTGTSQQRIYTSDSAVASIRLLAGSGTNASTSIVYTGSGTQYVEGGNVVLTGNGPGAAALIATATGDQHVRATKDILLTGGSASGAAARIESTAAGKTQRVGEAEICTFCSPEPYQTDNIVLQGGTNAEAAIVAAGLQKIQADLAIQVKGGTGGTGSARIANSSTSLEQRVGCIPGTEGSNCYQTANTLDVIAGAGGAFAEIVAAGSQRMRATSNVTLTGSADDSGYAKITAAGPLQRIQFGNTTMTAGAGAGSNVEILHTGTGTATEDTQNLAFGNLTLAAGGTAGGNTAIARISTTDTSAKDFSSLYNQRISAGGLTMTGGAGPNSIAEITTPGRQNLTFSGTSVMSGGAGQGAVAQITNTGAQSSQTLGLFGSFTMKGGAGSGAFARINALSDQTINYSALALDNSAPTTGSGAYVKIDTTGRQTLSGSSLTLNGGGAGEATIANAGAIIEGNSQDIFGSSMTLRGGAGTSGSTSDAVIRNLSGDQLISGGSFTLQGGHQFSTTGFLNVGSGTSAGKQTVSASSITMQSDPVTVPAHADAFVRIENQPATDQSIAGNLDLTNSGDGLVAISTAGNQAISAFGRVALNTSGSGATEVTAAGTQSVRAQYVDVVTSAGSTGNAKLGATGHQWIHTTGEAISPDELRTVPAAMPNYGLRVAAFGTGTASIESGASQLLEVTYPQVMQGNGLAGGLIVGGTAAGTAVAGTSRIKAVDQTIFAGTIWVETGLNASAPTQQFSEIKAANNQVISTLNGPIRVLGGAGNDTLAQIDPVTQTILVNGGIDVVGGSGTNAVAQILNGSGAQTLLATNGDIALTGGTGSGANAMITSGGLQTVGTSGSIVLTNGVNSLGGAGGSALISPLGNPPPGCASPCVLTTVASSGTLVAETLATNPVIDQFEELVELTDTALMAEDTTILIRRAPICR